MDVIALYDEHKNMVYRLALSFLRSVPDAEDATQQVFLRLIERGDKIAPGKERSWLAAVTANLCRDMLRSAARRRTEPLGEELVFRDGAQREVFQAVMELGERERAAVYLYYYEGFSTQEIGKALSISRTAVTSRLDRARQHLKEKLEEENDD